MSVNLEAGKLLDRFYERRAMSACAAAPFFKFGQVAWGNGYVNNNDGQLSVWADLPSSVNTITGEFARTNASYTYDEVTKNITVRASIPKGSLPVGVNAEFTALYVLDETGGVIALAVGMPVYMNSDRELTVVFVIDTARPTA